jgi:chemotaxis regulatin CheY-phosphate phosphatase CheZ
MRDFHAYRWLFDAYMAQDQYDETQQLIGRLKGLVEKAERRGEDPGYMPELADRLRKHQEQRTMTE